MAREGDRFYYSYRERGYKGYPIVSKLRNQDLLGASTCPYFSTGAVLEMQHWMKLIREGRVDEIQDINIRDLIARHRNYQASVGIRREECSTKSVLSWLENNVARKKDGSELFKLEKFESVKPLEDSYGLVKMLKFLFEKGPFVAAYFVRTDFSGSGDKMEFYMCEGRIRELGNGKPLRHAVAVVGFGIDKDYRPFWEYLESVSPYLSTYKEDGFNRVIATGFNRAYLLHV